MGILPKPLEKKLKKRYGDGFLDPLSPVKYLSTGIDQLDRLLGGGIAQGKIVEVFGKPRSGKTTLVYHLASQHLKRGGWVVWSDAEAAFDPAYAAGFGIVQDGENFLAFRPSTLEQQFAVLTSVFQNKFGGMAVIDSLAAALPAAELGDDTGTPKPGKHALIVGQNLRRYPSLLAQSGSVLIVINQTRTAMDIVQKGGRPRRPGGLETTPGGDALKFYTTYRFRLARVKTMKTIEVKGQEVQPFISRLFVVKNRTRGLENEAIDLLIVPGFACRYHAVVERKRMVEDGEVE